MREEWDSATTYEDGDELIVESTRVIPKSGLAWLWALLTLRPRYDVVKSGSQVWVVSDTPLDRDDFEEMDWQPLASGNGGRIEGRLE